MFVFFLFLDYSDRALFFLELRSSGGILTEHIIKKSCRFPLISALGLPFIINLIPALYKQILILDLASPSSSI